MRGDPGGGRFIDMLHRFKHEIFLSLLTARASEINTIHSRLHFVPGC